jgi:hypothetical protein
VCAPEMDDLGDREHTLIAGNVSCRLVNGYHFGPLPDALWPSRTNKLPAVATIGLAAHFGTGQPSKFREHGLSKWRYCDVL